MLVCMSLCPDDAVPRLAVKFALCPALDQRTHAQTRPKHKQAKAKPVIPPFVQPDDAMCCVLLFPWWASARVLLPVVSNPRRSSR